MPQDLSAERAAFEAWLNPGRHAGNVSPLVEPGRYAGSTHNIAWLAWRYGREAQAAEIAQLRAALEVSQAATDAAVKKAQWQAITNAELNALQDEVRKLKRAACQRFNEQFDDEPKL